MRPVLTLQTCQALQPPALQASCAECLLLAGWQCKHKLPCSGATAGRCQENRWTSVDIADLACSGWPMGAALSVQGPQ